MGRQGPKWTAIRNVSGPGRRAVAPRNTNDWLKALNFTKFHLKSLTSMKMVGFNGIMVNLMNSAECAAQND